ncbi:STAS domain-containing protein [Planosporangium mesophilum]|uniref:STAS domain-containing protein n=1 Tax=Planosporangium mesophilum TaxID=689768 RepID=UPI00143AD2C7|nr:STAS domain-containing protein [Planosporangium mesophilum]NJC81094.1 STAS domain-containing protein [Planosporangium mesophilum]
MEWSRAAGGETGYREAGHAVTDRVDVVVRRSADHTVVAASGSIYFDTHEALKETLLALAAEEKPRIVLDLSGVDLCDSSGLNMMAQTHLMATRHGGWLRLAGVQPIVRQVLDATHLTRMIPLYDTAEQADDAAG